MNSIEAIQVDPEPEVWPDSTEGYLQDEMALYGLFRIMGELRRREGAPAGMYDGVMREVVVAAKAIATQLEVRAMLMASGWCDRPNAFMSLPEV